MAEKPKLQEAVLNFRKGWPDKHFRLGDCEKALKSNAVMFPIWMHRPDTYYVVGLGKDDNVVYKSRGDT